MPLTKAEQDEMNRLELEQLEAEYAAAQNKAGSNAKVQPRTATDFAMENIPIGGGVTINAKNLMGTAADIGIESGGAAAGQAMGAPFAPATAGLSIPVGGFIGGFAGNTAAQLRRGGDYNLGEAVGAGFTGAIPGASLAKAPAKAMLKAGATHSLANLGATAAGDVTNYLKDRFTVGPDNVRFAPNPYQYALSAAGGFTAPAIGRFMDTGERATQTAIKTAQNAERDAVLSEVRAAGYKIPAHAVNPSKINKWINKLLGDPQTAYEAQLRARDVSEQIAKNALGIPEADSVTTAVLKSVKDANNAPYNALAGMSPRSAKDVVDLRILRDEAKIYAASDHAADKIMAKKIQNKADTLEDLLEYRAQNSGNPQLYKDFVEARKVKAQAHEIENALKPSTRGFDIDATRLARNISYLTDGLDTIAKAGAHFGQFTKAPVKEPGGILSLPLELARTPARKAYMSDIYTKFMGQPYYGMNAADFPAEMGRFATMNASRKPEPRPPSVPLFMTPAPQF